METINTVKVTKEIIESCIGFIAGFKLDKSLRVYNMKNSSFPSCLLAIKDNERDILAYVNNGETCQAVADKLGISKGTVTRHISDYKQRVAFYYEYIAFYEFASDVLGMTLENVLKDTYTGELVKNCKAKGIVYVRDFIDVYTHNSNKEAEHLTSRLRKEMKRAVFDRLILELCKHLK